MLALSMCEGLVTCVTLSADKGSEAPSKEGCPASRLAGKGFEVARARTLARGCAELVKAVLAKMPGGESTLIPKISISDTRPIPSCLRVPLINRLTASRAVGN